MKKGGNVTDSAINAGSGDAGSTDRSKTGATRRRDEESSEDKVGFFGKIIRFVRQIIGELKKVRYPTQEELWQYFLVVIGFVAVLMAFTGIVDMIFDKLNVLVFV